MEAGFAVWELTSFWTTSQGLLGSADRLFGLVCDRQGFTSYDLHLMGLLVTYRGHCHYRYRPSLDLGLVARMNLVQPTSMLLPSLLDHTFFSTTP
jgi:hypothetical protein